MKLSAIPAFLSLTLLPLVAFAEGKIEGKLLFSVDGGANYTETAPVVPAPQVIQVKAEWKVVGEEREIKDGIVMTSLWSPESDFASANVGIKDWGGKGWYQRSDISWVSVKLPDPSVVYPLDLKARPDGVSGKNNLWDKQKSSYVDGPLPAASALAPGVHKFFFRLSYRILDTSESVVADIPFQVTIGSK